MFSKEYALTFPFIVACYEYCLGQAHPNQRILNIGYRIAPYIAIIFSYLVVRSMVLPAYGVKFMHWETFWMRVMTVPKTLAIYFRLLVLPVNLTAHYETTLVSSILDPELWLPVGIVLCFGCLLYYTYHCSKASFLMLAWVVLTLIPVLNLIPLSEEGTFIAERYLYLPSAGFCIIVGQLMVGCWYLFNNLWLAPSPQPSPPGGRGQGEGGSIRGCRIRNLLSSYGSWHAWCGRKQKLILAFSVLSGGLLFQWYALGTLNRNLVWQGELALWADTVAQKPRSYRPYFNLAVAHRDAEEYEASLKMFEKAYWIASRAGERSNILANIAYVYYRLGAYDPAKTSLKEAMTLLPGNVGIYNLLGNVYFMEHDFAGALEQYRKAIEIDPTSKDPILNIGMVYFRMDEWDRVITHLESVKSMLPDDGKLYYYLGSAYDRKGMTHEAAKYYGIYLKLLPYDANYQKVARRLKKMEAGP